MHDPILVKIFTKILHSPSFSGHCLRWPWLLIPKDNQHIYEPKYICDQNWVKFPSLGCEIRCPQGFLGIVCCDLDVWPFDLISLSQALIHTSANLVKLAQIFTKIFSSRGFSGNCLLSPWPLTRLISKATQQYEPKYIGDQNLVKFS